MILMLTNQIVYFSKKVLIISLFKKFLNKFRITSFTYTLIFLQYDLYYRSSNLKKEVKYNRKLLIDTFI